jgi:hypothetical protein
LVTASRAGELDQFIAPEKAQLPEHMIAQKAVSRKRKAAQAFQAKRLEGPGLSGGLFFWTRLIGHCLI